MRYIKLDKRLIMLLANTLLKHSSFDTIRIIILVLYLKLVF